MLTRHSLDEGDFVYNLNLVDINVIPFTDHGEWRDALKFKLLAAQPKKKFDVVIVCALEKEADAFEGLGDTWARFMGEWLPRSGERMKDSASFEIYRNTPENTPKEKLETELYIPLE